VAVASEEVDMLGAKHDAAVRADDGAVVDVSGSRMLVELAGPARDVLASCCPLDLHQIPSLATEGRDETTGE
jgi:heterotetrameric sarcosine oxidase gamma subunit